MSIWTAEHDQVILDNRGAISAERIALLINAQFGWVIGKNAVIGRSHRLGLPNLKPVAPPRVPKVPRVNGERKERKAAIKVFVSPPVPVEPLCILFGDLQPHHCREVVGQDAWESLSCGHRRVENSSYCRWHHAINYTAPRASAPRRNHTWPARVAA